MGKKDTKRGPKKDKKDFVTAESEEFQVNSFKDLNPENLKGVVLGNRYAQMLIGLVIIGFALRFYHLGFNSIWLDEGSTLGYAKETLAGIWQSTAGGEFNPPLFYYLEHFMLVFGDSEFVLRFLPALFGSLTVPVMYLIGKEISGRCGGIIAAALMTFSSFHIYYSQDARAYTTMLFFFSLAVLFYLLAIKSGSLKYWILFGVFSALAFWTHFYVFVAVGVMILHALIVKRKTILKDIKTLKPILAGLLSFIVVSLPLIAVTVGLFFKRTSAAPTWGLSGLDVFTSTFLTISGSNAVLAVIFGLLAVVGIVCLYLDKDKRDLSYLLVLSIVLPFIVSIILSSRIPMSSRYMIYILPFFYASIAASQGFIPEKFDLKKVAFVAVIVLFLISVPYLSVYYTNYSKNDWRGFSQAISSQTVEGDFIVVMPGYMSQPLDYYYDNATDKTIEVLAQSSDRLDEIENERGNSTAYYVMTWDITAADPEGDAIKWLKNNTKQLGQYMGIYVFESK
ncbi:4-amino-4-deoxy-L-arabinose transferase-like glycosyltransferase [Methanomicrobium sp. W14]|uniref:glycosyltransferase family 39 protein n=1 Tax=Methanomicrobium sp. W14 TaxID=2817839 RepID=UPI001AE84150|nr:glycosyltransferase family 39 protein [Methanomicrobium sp. W14]MBP2134358.1 4-amino-4-deoxy-L-arabinose transferase-like glycosyltransferase [Methanomicrobium sp. W14]